MEVYNLLYDNNNIPTWKEKLEPYRDAIKNISQVIYNNEKKYGACYPLKENIFKCFEMIPLDKVKVVIWGQDPYPTLLDKGVPRAQGYAFGVSREDTVPQSLQNIYKEIKSNFPFFQYPNHGDLTWLTEQGVLLINSSLTYCPANPKCFLNLWNRFTNIIVKIINENVDNCIHLLWGKNCERLSEHIQSREVFIAPHPSPFSARRGFFGCKHFLKVNITLKRQGKEQINWNSKTKHCNRHM